MKTLAIFIVLSVIMILQSGCNTPAYTAKENGQRIARNWDYEGRQMTDDWDDFWLLTPASKMTMWNVRTTYP